MASREPAPLLRRRSANRLQEPLEDEIHLALVGHLQVRLVPGVVWHHSPNGGHRHHAVAGKLKAFGTRAGWPDFEFVRDGRVIFLEIKRRGGVVSPAQREVHRTLIRAGAPVLVAYGLDEALAALLNAGLIRPST